MKSISKLHDLEPYGIILLTGESDNLGFRCLCDLTVDGMKLICETFGWNYAVCKGFSENWNIGSDANPHVASILLDYDCYKTLAVLALITVDKCHTVLLTEQGTVFGLERGELYIRPEYRYDERLNTHVNIKGPEYKSPDYELPVPWPINSYGEVKRVIEFNHHHPHSGTRNVHTMSGRTN